MEKIKLTIIFRKGFNFLNFFTCGSRINGTNPIRSVVTVYLLIFYFFFVSCCQVSPGPKPVTSSHLRGISVTLTYRLSLLTTDISSIHQSCVLKLE